MRKRPLMFNFLDKVDYKKVLMNNTDPLDLMDKLNILDSGNHNFSPEVLILTKKLDIESDLLGIQLLRHGIEYLKITEEDIPLKFGIELNVGENNQYILKLGKKTVNCNNIKLVLFRYFDLKFLNYYSGIYQLYFEQQWYQLFNYLRTILKCVWINDPQNTFDAENRLHQLLTAQKLGLRIPETTITNIPDSGKAFLDKHADKTIIKVLHHHEITFRQISHRFLTTTIKSSIKSKLDDLKYAPLIFQKKIPIEKEIRITLIGDKIFPVQITTTIDKNEYSDLHMVQEKHLRFKPIQIERDLERKCLKMNQTLGLSVASLDFIVDINGETYFLEINPIGDWNWLEKHIDLPMTKTLFSLIRRILKKSTN